MPGLPKRNSAPRTPLLLAYPKFVWPFDWPTHMKILRNGPANYLEWPSRTLTYCKPFQVWFFVQLCSSYKERFQLS